MATGRVLANMISKIKSAVTNFVHVPGVLQSVQRLIGQVAATEAGVNHSEIRNVTYNGMTGVCFDITNDELKETHYLLQNSGKFEYYVLTQPNDPSKKNAFDRHLSLQMPQKTPAEGGDGASSSS
ncbi:hypothetical protein Bca52824_013449 [Brassica carinata]|uniref:Uncharacterized protein n=1 Tax=Brassica carinata TaxID=52824 RepID=A0A8X7VYY8_BRACI|nr:hypothetical protein Bca52824_013449 [Brassica carinata]